MPLFSSSSGNTRLSVNQDGSSNVHCYQCGEFITKTFVRVNRALCEMCRRVQAGEPITEEALREYERSKLGRANVTLLTLADQQPSEIRKFTLRSMVGEVFQALNFLKKEKEPAPVSTSVAKTKKRGRLFEQVQLGSIEEVDKKLKEPRL